MKRFLDMNLTHITCAELDCLQFKLFLFLGYLKAIHTPGNKVILVHVTNHLHNFAYNSEYIFTLRDTVRLKVKVSIHTL